MTKNTMHDTDQQHSKTKDWTLADLFADFDSDQYFAQVHSSQELDWGEPVGQEVW